MKYSEELIEKIAEVYPVTKEHPEYAELIELAEKGDLFLLRMLDESRHYGFSPESVLDIIRFNNDEVALELLESKAEQMLEETKVYAMCADEVQTYFKNQNKDQGGQDL